MAPAVHLSSIGLSHLERNPMSTLAHRAATVPRWSDLPLTRASKSYFLLGQNARGLWVIRENTGRRLAYSCRVRRPCGSRGWKAPTSTSPSFT